MVVAATLAVATVVVVVAVVIEIGIDDFVVGLQPIVVAWPLLFDHVVIAVVAIPVVERTIVASYVLVCFPVLFGKFVERIVATVGIAMGIALIAEKPAPMMDDDRAVVDCVVEAVPV